MRSAKDPREQPKGLPPGRASPLQIWADLAETNFNALVRGLGTAGPTEVTLGGYPGTRFEFSVPSNVKTSDCHSDIIRLWPGAGPDEDIGLPIAPGQTTTVYVVDVDGKGRVVAAIQRPESSAEDVAELDAVVESLQFEP